MKASFAGRLARVAVNQSSRAALPAASTEATVQWPSRQQAHSMARLGRQGGSEGGEAGAEDLLDAQMAAALRQRFEAAFEHDSAADLNRSTRQAAGREAPCPPTSLRCHTQQVANRLVKKSAGRS
jgi:hypothetical protein